ncbi:MAG: hypothetical protein GX947_09510 [Tissierellia bacterium]|nr:hypothetical protein [Tissierellia bacterium]
MDNKIEILGIVLGSIQGFILAKVYQSWAILYSIEGSSIAGKYTWTNTPMWEFSIKNPTIFLSIIVMIFALFGLFISKTYLNEKNKKC